MHSIFGGSHKGNEFNGLCILSMEYGGSYHAFMIGHVLVLNRNLGALPFGRCVVTPKIALDPCLDWLQMHESQGRETYFNMDKYWLREGSIML